MGGALVPAPPQQRPQPLKYPGEEQYVINASSSIFPRFSALLFFHFPEIEIGAEGAVSGGFERNKIENS